MTYLNRGVAEFNAGDYKVALADFNYYKGVKPNDPQCLYNIAVSYEKMKDYKLALDFTMQAQKAGFKVEQNYIDFLKKQIDHPTK